jgi:hypothetical protein
MDIPGANPTHFEFTITKLPLQRQYRKIGSWIYRHQEGGTYVYVKRIFRYLYLIDPIEFCPQSPAETVSPNRLQVWLDLSFNRIRRIEGSDCPVEPALISVTNSPYIQISLKLICHFYRIGYFCFMQRQKILQNSVTAGMHVKSTVLDIPYARYVCR